MVIINIIWIICSQASGSFAAGYHHLDHLHPGIRIICSRELMSSGSFAARHPDHLQPGIINIIWIICSQESGSFAAGNQYHLDHLQPGIRIICSRELSISSGSFAARHLVIACQASGHCLLGIMRDEHSG